MGGVSAAALAFLRVARLWPERFGSFLIFPKLLILLVELRSTKLVFFDVRGCS